MTTIKDVPRELLAQWLGMFEGGIASSPLSALRESTRALLDANPEENVPCPECGGSLVTWGCTCTPRWPMYKPAAQPQGEPVAYLAKRKNPTGNDRLDRPLLSLVGEDGWGPAFECVPLYTKQSQGEGEPVAHTLHSVAQAIEASDCYTVLTSNQCHSLARSLNKQQALYTKQPAPVAVVQKYDDALLPFFAMMRNELHANSHKGDREAWLRMTLDQALGEIRHHFDKLIVPVMNHDREAVREHAADVANCAMMLADIAGVLSRE